MRFLALAADYDGTLATDGSLGEATLTALHALRASGRALIMVTGRELPDLIDICPHLDVFSLVVAENGALLYWPDSGQIRVLAESPPAALVNALQVLQVTPLSVGYSIIATWEPHESTVLHTIRELGLEHQVIFNKGAVMVLPPGVNKASGLTAALQELRLSPHNVVGVGDAENDHSFLGICECAVAVNNALPVLKARADFVTLGDRGAGVAELIEELIATDLQDRDPQLSRHHLRMGHRTDGTEFKIPAHDQVILIVGPPMSGKTTLALGLMERLSAQGHQICVVDPEGDYDSFGDARVEVRRVTRATARVVELLAWPPRNVCVDLLGVPMADRSWFGNDFLPGLEALYRETARPHWLVLDEAHHLYPLQTSHLPVHPPGLVLITVDTSDVSRSILSEVDIVFATGIGAHATICDFYRAVNEPMPLECDEVLETGSALVSLRRHERTPFVVRLPKTKTFHRRHQRKYDLGDVGPGRGFSFREPWHQEVAYAPNLSRFASLALTVSDRVWFHHLHRGDYEFWFRHVIKDEGLADETGYLVAVTSDAPSSESRDLIRAAIVDRYAGPS